MHHQADANISKTLITKLYFYICMIIPNTVKPERETYPYFDLSENIVKSLNTDPKYTKFEEIPIENNVFFKAMLSFDYLRFFIWNFRLFFNL